ncbi:hypothetical protein [Streptomyces mirabilis]|uniref:hypothetical protein n=1 Tax=Streptomyces mirabilis TaxID=68239 RepID=UPI0036986E8C
MPDEQDKRRVYSLSDEHYQWSDMDDFEPTMPRIREALRPLYPDGETVDEVSGLAVYVSGSTPSFGSEQAVEATPQEMDAWRTVWAGVEEAQQAFRTRMEGLRIAFEQGAKEALADLTEATKPWAPVEADLKARSLELAAKLHAHRTAAKEWEQEREEKRQEHLDTVEGPRVIVLYKPNSLNSHRQADHIAKVHLLACKRRAKLPVPTGRSQHADEGLRAGEAWYRLTHTDEWTRTLWGGSTKNLRVKFCSFCKPWTVFQEHLDDFPWPLFDGQLNAWVGEVRLTEIPEAWTASRSVKES